MVCALGVAACAPAAERLAERPNVLLLTIDCLRADRLGCYGYRRPTSPGLDLLARQGVLFEDCVGQSGWTSPGLVSVLTGLYPEVTGIRGRQSVLPAGLPALPRLFRVAGYDVPNLSYLTSLQNYWNLGYEPPREELMRPEEDRHVVDFLERPHGKPFFAWYHYRFLHLPYDPPEPWRSQFLRAKLGASTALDAVRREVLLARGAVAFTPAERQTVDDLYDANVRRMDAYLSSIFAALDRTGLTSSTVVAVTADHGEELFERGFVGHASTSFAGTLHREILHLPLLVRAPGRLPAGRRVAGLCGQIDLAPTLLALAGVETAPGLFQGVSLLPMVRGEVADAHPVYFSSTTHAGYQTPDSEQLSGWEAATTRRWRLLARAPGGDAQLYDRVRDSGEIAPVRRPAERRQLEEMLARHHAVCRSLAATFAATGSAAAAMVSGPAPRIVKPDRAVLDFDSTGGRIEVRLEAAGSQPLVAEYEIGTGTYRTVGTMPLAGETSRFGPFSRELWRTLALWNPWRFRVARKSERPQWGPWREFRVEP